MPIAASPFKNVKSITLEDGTVIEVLPHPLWVDFSYTSASIAVTLLVSVKEFKKLLDDEQGEME